MRVTLSDDHIYIAIMRGLYAEARIRFREKVAPILVDADDETKAFAETLVDAIGEVSPFEAVTALTKFKAERETARHER